jgi:hypothetical protein
VGGIDRRNDREIPQKPIKARSRSEQVTEFVHLAAEPTVADPASTAVRFAFLTKLATLTSKKPTRSIPHTIAGSTNAHPELEPSQAAMLDPINRSHPSGGLR